jgi:PKHD-type hydroxylase
MTFVIPPPVREVDYGVSAATALNPQITKRLINLSKQPDNPRINGRVQERSANVVDISVRAVDAWVIHENYEWVDELIVTEIRNKNEEVYDFDLTGLIERPQLLRYKEGGHYDWHTDIGRGDNSTRKLSVSWVLNSDFDGGDLCFFQEREIDIPFREGQGCIFPSFMPHRVQPVTSGERWALVAWISGTPFR